MTRRYSSKVDANQAEIVALDEFGVDTTNNSYRGAGRKVCSRCGAAFHSYQPTRKFCSKPCYTDSRIVLHPKPCQHCGGTFKPSIPESKYCSVGCARAARPRVFGYVPRPRPKHIKVCGQCGVEFQSSPSQKRVYCGYSCHLKSGGAQRAGEASIMARMKYGAKKDANHTLIFGTISALTAAKDLSNAGFGVPDGIAWVNGGWHLFDIKNPKTGYGRRGLNPRQKTWAEDWRGGPVYLIYTVDEAIAFAKGNFAGLKSFGAVETVDAALAVLGIGTMPFRGTIG